MQLSPTFLSKSKTIAVSFMAGFAMTYFVCDVCSTSWLWYFRISVLTSSMWVSLWLGNESIAHYLDQKISWMTAPLKRAGVGLLAMTTYTISIVYALFKFYEWVWNFDFGDDIIGSLYISVVITFIITMFMTSRSTPATAGPRSTRSPTNTAVRPSGWRAEARSASIS